LLSPQALEVFHQRWRHIGVVVDYLPFPTFTTIDVRHAPVDAYRLLSERLSLYEKRIADIALKKVRDRVASSILELSEREGIVIGEGRYRIPTHYSHEDLATMVGAKRVSVTRAYGKLKEAKAVELKDRAIIVKDLDALRQAAS
jgi:CRP-like cAMP-binding protein